MTGLGGGPRRTFAVFCAAPHGAAAALLDGVLADAETAGVEARAVDLSADFRFGTAADYEAVYGHPHGAPARLASFSLRGARARERGGRRRTRPTRGASPPRCCMAAVPLLALGLVEPRLSVWP